MQSAWLCLLACVGATSAAHADVFTLTDLATLLQRHEAGSVRYVEHQFRKALTTPVEQQGELHFTPPDQFEKQVLQPVNERYALAGDTLTITQANGKRRQLSVRNQPLLRGLLLSFQSVVSGRLADLQPFYQATVSGNSAAWQLTLKPSDTQLQRYVTGIVVTGQLGEPQQFTLTETNGDRVVTEIQTTARLSNAQLSDSQLRDSQLKTSTQDTRRGQP